jgi:Protein of unknown function (DUF2971)
MGSTLREVGTTEGLSVKVHGLGYSRIYDNPAALPREPSRGNADVRAHEYRSSRCPRSSALTSEPAGDHAVNFGHRQMVPPASPTGGGAAWLDTSMQPGLTESPTISKTSTLYHYTTAAGLLGILCSSTLWATDVRFLNDAQEAIYAHELIEDTVRGMKNPVLDPAHFAYHLGEQFVKRFAQYQGYVIDALNSAEFGVYVACFCESGDLLSQWRGYGTDNGYAIELKTDALTTALDRFNTYPPAKGLAQVRYGSDAAADVVSQAVEGVGDFNLNHPGVKAAYKALHLAALLTTIKHPGFREENEWRLFAAYEQFQQGPMDNRIPHEPTRFRSTPMAIVPYIEVQLPSDAIVTVRVGPGNFTDVREAGVRRLLKSLGSNATVLRSDVPLRA